MGCDGGEGPVRSLLGFQYREQLVDVICSAFPLPPGQGHVQQDSHRFTFIHEHPHVSLWGGEQEGRLEPLHRLLCFALLLMYERSEDQHLDLTAIASLPPRTLPPAV